jgi:hypothetical protein
MCWNTRYEMAIIDRLERERHLVGAIARVVTGNEGGIKHCAMDQRPRVLRFSLPIQTLELGPS